MASSPYHIGFAPDYSPGLAMLAAGIQAQRSNHRSDEYVQMQRQAMKDSAERHSAEVERQKAETERKHAIEAGQAMPTLQRAAMRSLGLGNMLGKPYGVGFQETHDLPSNVEGPELSQEAEAARFAPKATAPAERAPVPEPGRPGSPFEGPLAPDLAYGYATPKVGEEHPDPSRFYGNRTLFGADDEIAARDAAWDAPGGDANDYYNYAGAPHTTIDPMTPTGVPQGSGIDALGEHERQIAAENAGNLADRVRLAQQAEAPPEPEAPLMARAAANTLGMEPGPEGQRRVFANYQGSRFEVPPQSDTTGFGEKYDRIYQRFLQEPGVDPEEALKAITKMAHEDAVEGGRDKRANNAEAARDKRDHDFRMTVANQFEQQRRALEQSDRNSRRSAAASMARTGDATTKQDKMDLGIERETDAIVKEVLNQTSYKGRVTDDQKFNQMSTVIAGAKSNAALAAAGAGMWVKQAQGGTGVISDSDMNQFWGKIGGVQDKVENYVTNALSGKMGAGKQKIVSEAVRTLAQQSRKNLEDVGKRIESRLYPIGEKVPQVDDRIQTYLDTYVPGAKRTTRARGGTGKTELDAIEDWSRSLGGAR